MLQPLMENNRWRMDIYPQLKEVGDIIQQLSCHSPSAKCQLEIIHKEVIFSVCSLLKLPKPFFPENIERSRDETRSNSSSGKRAICASSRKRSNFRKKKTNADLDRLRNQLKEAELIYRMQTSKVEQLKKIFLAQIEDDLGKQWVHHGELVFLFSVRLLNPMTAQVSLEMT